MLQSSYSIAYADLSVEVSCYSVAYTLTSVLRSVYIAYIK